MSFCRPVSLTALSACLLFVAHLNPLRGQQPPAQQKKQNPFEQVPQAPGQAKPDEPKPTAPAKPRLEAPVATPQAPPTAAAAGAVEDVIESIEFRGSRRVPQDTLRALIFSKKGDKLDDEKNSATASCKLW